MPSLCRRAAMLPRLRPVRAEISASGAVPSWASSAGVHGGPAPRWRRPAARRVAWASLAAAEIFAQVSGLKVRCFFMGWDGWCCGVEGGGDPRGQGEIGGAGGGDVSAFLGAWNAQDDD